MKFIDYVTIDVKAGNGGNGCIAFLREKFRPKGGPSGGDGGKGGSVYIQSDSNLSTLSDLTYNKHYFAEHGENGKGKNMHGRNGNDIFIKVPPGTIIRNSLTNQILKDLKNSDEKIVVARGGNGGFGNARFKTQKITAPRKSNPGQSGESICLDLELKVLADVGLVGFPNAGKSTFVSIISNAKPKIADYPFTTLTPNLGIVKYGNYQSFVVADIPGLIQGASSGKGLGTVFLRHIERTKILVYMIDVNDDITASLDLLRTELQNHNPKLINKPSIILITKTDTINKDQIKSKKQIDSIEMQSISSLNRDGINEALDLIIQYLK